MMPQLMEVLEFLDDSGHVMVARVPSGGECEIKWGAQLTVRESQNAAFFRDGQALAIFKPGRYVLKTQNLPLLTKLITRFGYGPDSPFRSEVYFLNMKLFRNLKWGTREPIMFRDPELHMVRLRSFGIFSIQISKPSLFLNKIVGTQGVFTDEAIEDYLRNIIITRLIDLFGEQIKSIFDLPRQYNELSAAAKAIIAEDLEALGLSLADLFINSIALPDEVQAVIDERTSMEAIGNMNTYIQYKAARAIQDAAQQEGGTAGAGVGIGGGIGMGMMIPGMIQNAFQQKTPQSALQNVEIQGSSKPISDDPFSKIERLKQLLDMGALTEEEFEIKKAELLKTIK